MVFKHNPATGNELEGTEQYVMTTWPQEPYTIWALLQTQEMKYNLLQDLGVVRAIYGVNDLTFFAKFEKGKEEEKKKKLFEIVNQYIKRDEEERSK